MDELKGQPNANEASEMQPAEMDASVAPAQSSASGLNRDVLQAAPVTSDLPVPVPLAAGSPPRRWSVLGAAAMVAMGAVLGAAGGTWVTYQSLQKKVSHTAPLSWQTSQATPVVFNGDMNVAEVYKKSAPGVVEIRADKGRSSGSGFIFDGRGYILTNFHVVGQNKQVKVMLDDQTVLDGTVLGADPSNDLAVVRVESGGRALPVLPLGDSDTVEPGEPAIAIGFPLGEGKSITAGIISGKNRDSESPTGWPQLGLIQTDAALNPGNSGGPLLNAAGEVVGINAQAVSKGFGGIGLAVPINTAKRLIPDMIAGKTVEHAWLGISGGNLTEQIAQEYGLSVSKGVIVEAVVENSPAEAAGLRGVTRQYNNREIIGDVIVAVDGNPIANITQISAHLQTMRPGNTMTLAVLRDGSEIQINITLQPRPATTGR